MATTEELYAQLSKLIHENPETAAEVWANPPEIAKPIIDLARAQMAGRSFTPEAYANFHAIITGHELPAHGKKWVLKMFQQFNKKGMRGLLNKASRGFTKSTVGIGFALFCHGHFPWGSGLISQARDTDAKKTAKFMADTIESNMGWKAAFPNIVPDVERGWSEHGYHIKDSTIPYSEWVKKTSGDHGRDPSFVAVSIISGSIGMHPTLYLMLDDIHDQKNTASQAEREAIKKTLKSDVLPTMSNPAHPPFLCVSYTPWADDDAYADLEKSGIFEQIVTPAFYYDPDGKDIWDGKPITLSWPDAYPVETLKTWQNILGSREFGRMFQCDLEVGRGEALRYYTFPHDRVDNTWPMVGGVDVPYDFKERHQQESKLSAFAMTYLAKRPQGGAVVTGGILEHPTIAKAYGFIMQAQNNYVNWGMTHCESVGGGNVFRESALAYYPQMKIMGSDLGKLVRRPGEGGGRAKNKKTRIQTELAPWLENGTIMISDDPNDPLLKAIRSGLDNFAELEDKRPDERLDALDSLYHAAKGFPEILIGHTIGEELPSVFKSKSKSPFDGRMALRRKA